MPAGRPSLYDPAFCDKVIEVGIDGGSLAEMAEACDVERHTLNAWMEAHPEFSTAVKRGLQKAQVWWERQGKIATFGGAEGFNATSYTLEIDADSIGTAGYTAMKSLTEVQTDSCLRINTRNGALIYQPATFALNEAVQFQEGQVNRVRLAVNSNGRLVRYAS